MGWLRFRVVQRRIKGSQDCRNMFTLSSLRGGDEQVLFFVRILYHNTAFRPVTPDKCLVLCSRFPQTHVNPPSTPRENTGATITGTHWCDDELISL